tara:strand:- start:1243 stop:1683 length:441 start_codon:yes stop_codon:yes gene_type:complete
LGKLGVAVFPVQVEAEVDQVRITDFQCLGVFPLRNWVQLIVVVRVYIQVVISFFIAKNRRDKKGFVRIYGQVINSKNYIFQIEKVKPRHWNSGKQRVNKNRENEPDNRHEEINGLIEKNLKNPNRFGRFKGYSSPPEKSEVKNVFF